MGFYSPTAMEPLSHWLLPKRVQGRALTLLSSLKASAPLHPRPHPTLVPVSLESPMGVLIGRRRTGTWTGRGGQALLGAHLPQDSAPGVSPAREEFPSLLAGRRWEGKSLTQRGLQGLNRQSSCLEQVVSVADSVTPSFAYSLIPAQTEH